MKALLACMATMLGFATFSEFAFAQRYRDYDDDPRPRHRGDRNDRGYDCLSSDEINARLRNDGYRALALRDQGPNVLVMSTVFRGRPYLIFVNACTGVVKDTRNR